MPALAVIIALLVGGCASAGGGLGGSTDIGAANAAPDLLGTWIGTWAGTPVTLVLTEQGETGREGFYAGSWILFGRKAPGLVGVLTSTVRGRTVTTAAQGVVAQAPAGVSVTVNTRTTFGDQRLTLKTDGPDRLVGSGESAFGPTGAVVLTRAR